MVNILDYNEFVDELKKTVYKNAKADLINKVASNPDRYTGIFDIHFLAVIGVSFLSSFAFISLILFIVSCIDKMGQKNLEKKIEYDEEKHDEIK